MKHLIVLAMIALLVIGMSVTAQTDGTAAPDKEEKAAVSATDEAAEATEVPCPENTKVPRRYPIAAGVWYPGDPLPTEPSRYYRIRCWPGCHSYGEWATPPESKETQTSSY
jgi:hypothetical protein